MRTYWLAVYTLWQREMVRFFRQRSRVIGALGPPVLFWFLIGSGLGASFKLPGSSASMNASGITYMQYFFPGTVILIVLFTSIFSTISIIEDRHEGFLQSVLVAPLPRSGLVLGNIMGGTTLAFVQGLIFLCFAPWAGITIHPLGWFYILVVLASISFGLTGLGFSLAWRLDSTQGFHAIMNLFLIPMWLLSGALFPVSGAPAWLRGVMLVNPLTYGLSAFRESMSIHGQLFPGVASPIVCLAVILLFGLLTFTASIVTARGSK